MPEERFPICTPEPPPMIGREQIMCALVRELTKTTPSHRSVVGARYTGKSVILAELARRMAISGASYIAVIKWDLGHSTPRTDEAFLESLARKIADGLVNVGENEYGDHLRKVQTDFYAETANVLDLLEADGKRILMLWDGFDKPLTSGTLTRNLWDNLRELCLKSSLRLVTATRRNLGDLIRDEKSVTSDFWNIFGDCVRVNPFTETDVDSVLATLPNHSFASGAKTELINWSGGNPPLMLSLLNALVNEHEGGQINNDHVNCAARSLGEHVWGIVNRLWSDCPSCAQDLRLMLPSTGGVAIAGTLSSDREALVEKGFAIVAGQVLRPACRLLDRHFEEAGSQTASLARLFGTWDDYKSNITEVLKRRLSHIPYFDKSLYQFVDIAVKCLDIDPESALNNLTSIEDRALDIIWARECDPNKKIPEDTVKYWTMESPRSSNRIVKEMMTAVNFEIPSDRFKQLGVLQMLTGSCIGFDAKARSTKKDAYVLLNAIHNLRNRNEHAGGQEIHLGVAAATLMLCVELLACLSPESTARPCS